MRPSVWHRIDLLARQLSPVLLTLVLVVISVVPVRILDFSTFVPLFPLASVYHWTIFRPNLLPIYAVFLIGILQDVLTGSPIGVNAFVYLLVYGAVLSQNVFFTDKSFFILWIGFALISAGAVVVNWFIISILNVTVVEIQNAVTQYFLTLGFFPAAAWFFLRWQGAFLRMD
ncbi:MAG: rod shape-determining protein MreD [Pseudomonadota bacterium]|nr:rod shape-determining protein MreD [Pseudomonadota bacterium]